MRSRFQRTRLRAVVTAAAALAVSVAIVPGTANAQNGHKPEKYQTKVLAKAKPDECFAGVGVDYPAGPPCAEGQAKVNGAYVWGLTQVATKVWFGTGENVNCLVNGATLGVTTPVLNDDYVCEYDQSEVARENPDLPGYLGDHRPPEFYYYDTKKSKLVSRSELVDAASEDDAYRRKSTVGLRAGGSFNGVVLLAGPALGNTVNMFAFDGNSGAYLGSRNYTQWGNIRHFLVASGALYAGVGIGRNGDDGGAVLKWTGTKADPFEFEVVADLPAQAADLAYTADHIYISTWPKSQQTLPQHQAGIWMSPALSGGTEPGLEAADAASWTQVWYAGQYEPDRIMSATYGMGGLAAYGGYVYWGTMHVPMKATKVYSTRYPQTTDQGHIDQVKYTQRAISVFRGKAFGTSSQKIDLLYGESQLPTYDPTANSGVGAWSMKSTGYTPLYGASGFGNRWNNYEWIMTVTDGKLFVGTMDWSYLAKDLIPDGASGTVDPSYYGGDLWVFECANQPAKAVSTTGVGNYLNYGVRNIIADGKTLYLGMANPMNLRTDPTDDVPEGGWELIKLTIDGK